MSSELCDSLSVVFTDSPKIEDHLFAKAIRWSDQNPEDIIFWARRKALNKIPEVDVDWSSKVRALRSIRFGYNKKNLLHGCIDEAIKATMNSEIAAIICSLNMPKTCSQLGSLLASLAAFCQGNDGRAVVVIDLREEEDEIGQDDTKDETDPFENLEFLDEEEKKIESVEPEESEEDKKEFLKKLKLVSGIYTKNVLTFDGDTFSNVGS